jgi:hypothetical protein
MKDGYQLQNQKETNLYLWSINDKSSVPFVPHPAHLKARTAGEGDANNKTNHYLIPEISSPSAALLLTSVSIPFFMLTKDAEQHNHTFTGCPSLT